ncbi:NAD-dependent epimerase/dehydratase family protein [Nocardioides marmoriginsengisoli]|uniref:NAD-dependent epimerase/dehydratase family protein n=1 Tax=Nocardioides marmoriginsengisoli TaxID=661483 RepID=A0A3N0CGL1_9ACTN|nr:NAD-dependent epimerase/dehydratase family protein [Nocardioides marmoriginsengisoli]RNL62577.1 NAD-dependent epimerase/dehydratase family protein [Nocardioides marmoriginsengisoli]
MGVALVTGVAGFVGSAVARAYLDAGLDVLGVDAMRATYSPDLKRDNLRSLLRDPRFTFHERDLVRDSVADLVAGVDAVSHQAGRAGLRDSWRGDFGSYLDDNVAATKNLLDAVAGEPRIRRVVVASSSSVYGDAASYPTREDALPTPLSPYGVSKLAAERLAVAYASAHGVPVVCLRYFTVFGPGQRPDMAFHRMIAAATGGPAFPLLGTGEQVRDFTYVGDVAEANLAALAADPEPGTVLNIAGGVQASVLEALDVVAELAGSPVRLKRRPAATGEARRTSGATDAARALLGWEPRTSLRAGLEAQYAAHVDQVARLGGSVES